MSYDFLYEVNEGVATLTFNRPELLNALTIEIYAQFRDLLEDLRYDDTVKVLLAHQPRSADAAEEAGFDLQLSGHTHGGIISLGRWLKSLEQPFQSGLYTYKSMKIYVSNGAGYYFLPVRFGSPSEISLLTLTGIKSA